MKISVVVPAKNESWVILVERSVPKLAPHVYIVLMIAVTLVLLMTALTIYTAVLFPSLFS